MLTIQHISPLLPRSKASVPATATSRVPLRYYSPCLSTSFPATARPVRLALGKFTTGLRATQGNHPDWPSSRDRYEGLRDEDILELESFLNMFRQARAQEVVHEEQQGPGEVYLVGTGPGDPGLLTLRAVQLMQTADVVLYDRLVSDDILNLVGKQARMVYVGKHSGFHTRTQDEIHSLLLAFAEAGATVIRLKGGDPYVFGRGGEEVQYLAAQGITVQCVPGITAASGICAELGIPMTHRGVATSVRFLTGHARDGGEQELLDSTVAGAADPHTTLVVYMGLQTLPKLYDQLSAHGMPADLPAVAIERGTTRRQRVVWGPVSELPSRASEAGLKSPTLIIMGSVVALAPGWLDWESQGRPVLWKHKQPAHQYALPAIDAQLLVSQVAGSQQKKTGEVTSPASSSSRQFTAEDDGGIRTRDVPLTMGAAAATASRAAVLNMPVSTQSQQVVTAANVAAQELLWKATQSFVTSFSDVQSSSQQTLYMTASGITTPSAAVASQRASTVVSVSEQPQPSVSSPVTTRTIQSMEEIATEDDEMEIIPFSTIDEVGGERCGEMCDVEWGEEEPAAAPDAGSVKK